MNTEKTLHIEHLENEVKELNANIKALELQNKQLEAHLQQSKERTWSSHWELDLITKKIIWSDSMYRLLQISKSKKPDMKLFNDCLPPVSRDKLNGAIKKTFITQEDYSFEHQINVGDNILNVRTDLKIVLGENNKPVRLLGITSDITSIKTAQQELEKLSMIASKTSNGVVIMDKETKIEWINQGFTLMMGFRIDEVEGLEFKRLMCDETLDLADKDYIFKVLSQNHTLNEETKLNTKHKDELWALINITPILDYELNPESYIVVMSDITNKKHNEALLKEQKEEIGLQKEIVEKKNQELSKTVKQLARAKISRKSLSITLIVAVMLFVVSELVVDPYIESYFVRSSELVLLGKLLIFLMLKPIEDTVRRSLFRSEVKKKTLQ